MKTPLLFFTFLSGISLFLLSCDNNRVFETYKATHGNWHKDSLKKISVDIQDTLSPFNVYINVRHDGSYGYSNLYVFLTTTFPSGKTYLDTIESVLASPKGNWYGTGWGDILDLQVPIKKNIRFPEAGKYTFIFEQGMREPSLKGVHDIGLRLEINQ